jgi:5-methylcytosine-specific restriction endonuclease McrA
VIRKSKRARSRARMVRQLDAAARQEVFERDHGVCVRCCDPRKAVQWSHVIGRRHKCTRWEPDNALSLCYSCHRWWHEYPSLSGPWFAHTWPERQEHIVRLYNAGGKVDINAKLTERTEK